MGKIIKNIKFRNNFSKFENITTIKRELRLTVIEARDLYNAIESGELIGKSLYDTSVENGLYYRLSLMKDVVDIEVENAETDDEKKDRLKQEALNLEAKKWFASLSSKELEYFYEMSTGPAGG